MISQIPSVPFSGVLSGVYSPLFVAPLLIVLEAVSFRLSLVKVLRE